MKVGDIVVLKDKDLIWNLFSKHTQGGNLVFSFTDEHVGLVIDIAEDAFVKILVNGVVGWTYSRAFKVVT